MRRNKIVYGSMALVILFSLNVIPRISLSEEPETVLSEASILDASYLDKILDYSDTIKLPVIGVEELPVLDAALDTFDELSPIDFELGFTLANAYIWRGQTLGGDASFQPYVTVSPSFEPIGDLSFTFWADITKDESGENQREYDFVVDYNFDVLDLLSGIGYSEDDAPHVLTKLLDFNFDTGYIYYKFPPQPDTKSQEVYLALSMTCRFIRRFSCTTIGIAGVVHG
ncbi:MAG: hypothetical protein KKH94_13245 [Candidatus Omnitrophica bacterium]|nr:hypothetical protein [Candidatus Omnitrophota bacterium]